MNGYSPVRTLYTPAHVSSLAFGHAGHVFAGCDDGTLRVYDLSSFKVLKAVRGLGAEVSSVVCVKRAGAELRDAWVACATRVLLFKMDTPALVLTPSDALASVEVCGGDDILNEISLDAGRRHLAFCTDSGVVGVLDLGSTRVSVMQTKHDSVCGCVKFVPDRPRELVSGGYDKALLHFDCALGSVLSRHDISLPPAGESGMSFSPPFILCTALSPTGVIAAGTADGHIWFGRGGMKVPSGKGKKTRKWNGLDAERASMHKLADGPVVAIAFCDPDTLIFSTLLGSVTELRLNHEGQEQVEPVWQQQAKSLAKVNALVVDDNKIVLGGISGDGKGVIEIWAKNDQIKP